MMLNYVLLFLIQITSSATSPSQPLISSTIINDSQAPHHQRRNTWSSISVRLPQNSGNISNRRFKFGTNFGALKPVPESKPTQLTVLPSSNPKPHHRRRNSLPDEFSASSLRFFKSGFYRFVTKLESAGELNKSHEFQLFIKSFTKKAVPNCNCDFDRLEQMKEFIFKSDISNKKLKVKVAINEGYFAGGKFAKALIFLIKYRFSMISIDYHERLYNGCFEITEGKDPKWKCVGVKLVGKGTIQGTKQELEKMNDKEIMEDPKNEVKNLQKIKNTFKNPNERKHIINLYDGGEIKYSDKIDKVTYGEYFKYAVILELGENNYLDEFIKKFANKSEINEKEIMGFFAEGIEPFINLHEILVYMDLKPQNLVYVKEIIDRNKSGISEKTDENGILKVIDFGGAHFLEKNQKIIQLKDKKLTSTFYILPPEMDQMHYYYMHNHEEKFKLEDFNPTATTKSDMWEFGILIYHLLLMLEYPEADQKEILTYLDIINKIYKFGNEAEKFEDIHEFIGKMDLMPIKEKDEILAYAQILNIRSKYPRHFILATNLLTKNPAVRLLTQDAFDYLIMKCKMKIEMEKREEDLNFIKPEYALLKKFIGKITIKMLQNSKALEEKAKNYNIKLQFNSENIKKLINEDEDNLDKITKICGQS